MQLPVSEKKLNLKLDNILMTEAFVNRNGNLIDIVFLSFQSVSAFRVCPYQ